MAWFQDDWLAKRSARWEGAERPGDALPPQTAPPSVTTLNQRQNWHGPTIPSFNDLGPLLSSIYSRNFPRTNAWKMQTPEAPICHDSCPWRAAVIDGRRSSTIICKPCDAIIRYRNLFILLENWADNPCRHCLRCAGRRNSGCLHGCRNSGSLPYCTHVRSSIFIATTLIMQKAMGATRCPSVPRHRWYVIIWKCLRFKLCRRPGMARRESCIVVSCRSQRRLYFLAFWKIVYANDTILACCLSSLFVLAFTRNLWLFFMALSRTGS